MSRSIPSSSSLVEGLIKTDCAPKVQVNFFVGARGVKRVVLTHASTFTWEIEGEERSDVKAWVLGYLEGVEKKLPSLDFPSTTSFQKDVLKAIQSIPFGEVRTYQEIAEVIGNPRAVRAVGTACGSNPFPLLIPCHRVIASNGKLGGFTPDLSIKMELLAFES